MVRLKQRGGSIIIENANIVRTKPVGVLNKKMDIRNQKET